MTLYMILLLNIKTNHHTLNVTCTFIYQPPTLPKPASPLEKEPLHVHSISVFSYISQMPDRNFVHNERITSYFKWHVYTQFALHCEHLPYSHFIYVFRRRFKSRYKMR